MRLLACFVIFFSFCASFHTLAQNSTELKNRKNALTQEIELLNKRLNKTSNNKRLSLKQIQALNTQIHLREVKIKTINTELSLLKNELFKNTSMIKMLEKQLIHLKEEYIKTILFAFRNKNSYNQLMFIFAAKDFNQAYKRLKYLHQISVYRKKQAKSMKETEKSLTIKIKELARNRRKKSHLLHDEKMEKQTLGEEKINQAKVLSGLNKQEKELKQKLTQKQKESIRLNQAIRNAINKDIKDAKRKAEEEARNAIASTNNPNSAKSKSILSGSSVLVSTPESAKLSSDFLSSRGNLPWPVAKGIIKESFGMHHYGSNVKTENNGIDIKTAVGSTIRAVFAGEVTTVQKFAGSYVILIRHGEYFTVYSNLRSVNVSKGEKVSLKQQIGTVLTDTEDGTTEVHFEVRKGALPLNPETWLSS